MWVYNQSTPDPHSHTATVITINLLFPALALLAIAFRFFVRLRLKRTPWLDDYAALSSAVLAGVYGAIAVAQSRWGLGLNAAYFPVENVVPFGKIQYAGGPVYTMALLGFKISLLSSYLRIGGFVNTYKYIIFAAIAACTINQLIFTFLLLFACNPVAKQWDATIPGHCINTVPSYYGLAGTSLGFDILIIALPLPVLGNLQLRRKQKIALMGVFALGFFVTIIQIIRIFTVKNLKSYTDSRPIVIWSVIEISLGVISTCIPTYAPLFRAFTSLNSYYNRYGYYNDNGNAYALATRNMTNRASRRHANTHTNQSTSTSRLDRDLEILDDGTTIGKGGGFETTIMSVNTPMSSTFAGSSVGGAGGSVGRPRDSDSEELIKRSALQVQMPAGVVLNQSQEEPPGTGVSGREEEDAFQIHTFTEFKIERHQV
ncbi:putative integral membrane protein (Pth11) [Aspergillus chevalieri]|uniref:Rhodopsin domain-containing protein n=1 Tax=Aspergillus chevalieri TaxID=182096 RepID=A0A7R7ZPR3_ASPCH|nr:uncharacterized protein ACHE_50077A [Aspergillus chevalieri]BCR88879.1 hypothetical protein ACHE_50077A [Aspergillus chevalieri]